MEDVLHLETEDSNQEFVEAFVTFGLVLLLTCLTSINIYVSTRLLVESSFSNVNICR